MAKEGKERGAKDDWEALVIVLDQNQALRQRVMHKLRELKKSASLRTTGLNVTKEQLDEARRAEKLTKK